MKAVVVLADGFEEIEAMTPVDVLRRANVDVVTAGLNATEVQGAHGVVIKTDVNFSDLAADDFDVAILPGGMPGSTNLASSQTVCDFLNEMLVQGKKIAAICAAPLAFDAAGVLNQRKFTCYPGVEQNINSGNHVNEKIVVDGAVITSQGPGTAMLFALTILEELGMEKEAQAVAGGMLIR